jgi:hypothetical protein
MARRWPSLGPPAADRIQHGSSTFDFCIGVGAPPRGFGARGGCAGRPGAGFEHEFELRCDGLAESVDEHAAAGLTGLGLAPTGYLIGAIDARIGDDSPGGRRNGAPRCRRPDDAAAAESGPSSARAAAVNAVTTLYDKQLLKC